MPNPVVKRRCTWLVLRSSVSPKSALVRSLAHLPAFAFAALQLSVCLRSGFAAACKAAEAAEGAAGAAAAKTEIAAGAGTNTGAGGWQQHQ